MLPEKSRDFIDRFVAGKTVAGDHLSVCVDHRESRNRRSLVIATEEVGVRTTKDEADIAIGGLHNFRIKYGR